jgi:hypothetical protein
VIWIGITDADVAVAVDHERGPPVVIHDGTLGHITSTREQKPSVLFHHPEIGDRTGTVPIASCPKCIE